MHAQRHFKSPTRWQGFSGAAWALHLRMFTHGLHNASHETVTNLGRCEAAVPVQHMDSRVSNWLMLAACQSCMMLGSM